METFLLSAGLGATATAFYACPSTNTARKLFRGSLLYLLVLMAAMIYHRVPNSNLRAEELSPANGGRYQHIEDSEEASLATLKERARNQAYRPPIAALSVAPFPFLPAPEDRTSTL